MTRMEELELARLALRLAEEEYALAEKALEARLDSLPSARWYTKVRDEYERVMQAEVEDVEADVWAIAYRREKLREAMEEAREVYEREVCALPEKRALEIAEDALHGAWRRLQLAELGLKAETAIKECAQLELVLIPNMRDEVRGISVSLDATVAARMLRDAQAVVSALLDVFERTAKAMGLHTAQEKLDVLIEHAKEARERARSLSLQLARLDGDVPKAVVKTRRYVAEVKDESALMSWAIEKGLADKLFKPDLRALADLRKVPDLLKDAPFEIREEYSVSMATGTRLAQVVFGEEEER